MSTTFAPRGRVSSRFGTLLLASAVLSVGVACEEEQGLAGLQVKGAFDPDALDFGEVTVGESKRLPVTLTNVGPIVFTIEGLERPMGFDLVSDAKSDLTGIELGPSQNVQLEAVFYASEAGERSATIEVLVSTGRKVSLPVRGVAVERRLPKWVVTPTMVDFGTVELSATGSAMVTIRNEGDAPGTLTAATLANGSDATSSSLFQVTTPLPITLAEGTEQQVTIVFRPFEEGERLDRVTFASAVAVPPVDLRGLGAIARGALVCTPSSLAFGRVQRGNTRELAVNCQARGGLVRLVGATISAGDSLFALPTPVGAMDLQPNQGQDLRVAFTPDGLPRPVNGELTVSFNGASGLGTVRIPLTGEVQAPPPTATAMSAVLTWDTNLTDVDLQLVRPNAQPFDQPGACYWRSSQPDWGVVGDTSDNPFLDVDDIDGRGPENINLSTAASGTYRVYVHFWASPFSLPTRASVQVFVGGMSQGTLTRSIRCNELWLVGEITWDAAASMGTFRRVDTSMPTTESPGCR